ncbi:MAG: HAD-IC family P-type ATPase [Kofleriaceae bacterium]|nr:HAD-IC family P-type ATPase [Kofleriaceae bacterium]
MSPVPAPPPSPSWHALPATEVVAALATDAAAGLPSAEARRRLAAHGPNALGEAPRRSLPALFFGQFRSPLIYLLFVAAGLAAALGHTQDALVIAAVVMINAIIGSAQEGRAERSLEALRRTATHNARLIRDGHELVAPARELVPGDVLLLEAGDAVPADARLLTAAALQVAEAALTGESVPVRKDPTPLAADTPLVERHDMLHAGTLVTAGRARAVVVATGAATAIGQIAALAERAQDPPTPLERRVAQFGRYIIVGAGIMFVVVNAIGLARGLPFDQIVLVAISQLVGMIPEGLPVAMTIALAVGVQRIARRNAVVRRLAAVETLGSTTIICTDKTGTLTRNEMTATAVHLADGRDLTVTGVGYEPAGELRAGDAALDPAAEPALRELLEAVALCNDAQLRGPEPAAPRWTAIGDPTEVALLTLAAKGGVALVELRARWPRQAELPFDAATRAMATQHARDGGAGARVIVKGAPEVVVELCRAARAAAGERPLDLAAREAVHAATERLAARALRVLAVAVVDDARLDPDAGLAGLRGRAVLLGLIGQIDPPRAEVHDAVARCRAAGIRPIMVTGDHQATGQAIARELGIAGPGDLAVDGRELERLDGSALAERLDRIAVFARVHPAQKLRIIEAYQRRGEVVAMTGDGVNDTPALVKADVGVAMGQSGTEAAKEASKIVLGDDNFATIVAAVEEGRVVYRNIKKTVLLLFSTSAAEVLVLTLAIALGYPAPFAAVQILWNNLVTEGVITVNLVMEPPEGDEMRRPPISPHEPLLTRLLLGRLAVMAVTITACTLGWFIYRLESGVPFARVQTETFTLLAVCEWWNVLNCRSDRRSALDLGIFKNPWLVGGLIVGNLLQVAVVFWSPMNEVFRTVPFGLDVVLALGVVGSLVLWVEELRKLAVRRRLRRAAAA